VRADLRQPDIEILVYVLLRHSKPYEFTINRSVVFSVYHCVYQSVYHF
jgi:hypothetical protein